MPERSRPLSGTPSIDVERAHVVEYPLADEPLCTLDALADAADRVPAGLVEHHLGDLPVVSPGGESVRLDQSPGDVVRGVASNRCWVMIRSLASLPEYEALLRRVAARYELALRAHGDRLVEHDLIAFVGGPGATVPVHFDRNHHLLVQVRGSKIVGTGTFHDAEVARYQLVRGMQPDRYNADVMPDDATEHALAPGQAVVIPAYTFHWVRGGDDVSISLTCVVATEETKRTARELEGAVKR
jgi:hypothetical protein